MGFQFRTREGASPQGKPGLLLCCCPEDIDGPGNELAGALLERYDCVVWLDDGWSYPGREEDLARMDLAVAVVTQKSLTAPGETLTTDLDFALSHHIPVLPVKWGPVEEGAYAARFGTLQYLERSGARFEEELDRYLDMVLLSDGLTRQVKGAFAGSLFLSYRKADRAWAKELIARIHAQPGYRDVAVWYDDFLVPGRRFDREIMEELAGSDGVLLLVTPNLLEDSRPPAKGNYVMNVEYPEARERGKTVLPVRAGETDRAALERCYPGLPEDVDLRDREALSRRLREMLAGVEWKNQTSPDHLYHMGLAYLSGIGVEKDPALALELLVQAVNGGSVLALQKLAQMHRTGQGVKRDLEQAYQLQTQLAAELLKRQKEKPEDGALWGETAVQLCRLGDDAVERLPQDREGRCAQVAEEAYMALEELCRSRMTMKEGQLTAPPYVWANWGLACERRGTLYRRLGLEGPAREYQEKALEIRKYLMGAGADSRARRDYAISCRRMGETCESRGRPDLAREKLRESRDILEALDRAGTTEQSCLDLMVTLEELGKVCGMLGDLAGARESFERALSCAERLVALHACAGNVSALMSCCIDLGDLCRQEGVDDFPQARAWFRKAVEAGEGWLTGREAHEIRWNYALAGSGYADSCAGMGGAFLPEAVRVYRECLAMIRQMAEEAEAARDPAALELRQAEEQLKERLKTCLELMME